eukprot:365617-Chlamydomonas_euryale.AAC.12
MDGTWASSASLGTVCPGCEVVPKPSTGRDAPSGRQGQSRDVHTLQSWRAAAKDCDERHSSPAAN